eukprot:756156_1
MSEQNQKLIGFIKDKMADAQELDAKYHGQSKLQSNYNQYEHEYTMDEHEYTMENHALMSYDDDFYKHDNADHVADNAHTFTDTNDTKPLSFKGAQPTKPSKKRGPPKGCKQMGGRAKTTDYGGLAETMETIKAGNIEDIKKVAKKQICMAAASVLTMLNVKVNRKKMQKIIDKWEEGKDKKDITKAKTGTSAFYGAYDPSTASVSAGPVAIVRKAMTGTDALKVVQKVLGLVFDTEEKDENENKDQLSLPNLRNQLP